ncbi:penicillin-binding transpeptidase domain-containing protein [uncultured Thomasclavelia sp.]|mgnify:CR=1 FL=1|uniref:penicillin-binding transpeptidase domain-containing protein n=1 Tax=uncultured Thomasclavelia sp. TaxID=3025759 RepID=UPI0025CEDDAB|nr:penicillin-binding transpeptidase domain-containing protein [uncultured Thomasclavelia sp.]
MFLKNKRNLIIIGAVVVCLIVAAVLFIFIGGKSAEDYVTDYFNLLSKKDYSQMYEMLSDDSNVDQDTFEERYANIYNGIEASNFNLVINSVEDDVVDYSLTMDTVAGEVTSNNQVTVVDDKLVYNEGLILEGLESNYRVRILTDNASRGRILDRNGQELATQGEAYSVGLVPGKLNGEADYDRIASMLGITSDDIRDEMSASWIKDDSFVPIKEVARDSEGQALISQLITIPGVKANTITVRYYPYGQATSHLTGYLQQVTAEDLKNHEGEGYSESSLIGRSGIEAAYEADLRGSDGKEIRIVDENNDLVKTVAKKEVTDGKDITLTIDVSLQQALYNEYQNDQSASVAMNPETGEILALVSTPSFSSNDFILGYTNEQWQALNDDASKPLTNRYRATFVPGSSMKPITGAIGLDSGAIDANEDLQAQDRWQKDSSWGNYYVTTLHAPTPNNLRNALIYSDNVYFAKAATNIGSDDLIAGYDKLQIGSKIPFELALTKSQYQNEAGDFDDQQLADSGYGQGELLMNPVQLASIYTAFYNEGTIVAPYLVMGNEPDSPWVENAFTAKTANTIKDDLIGVISDSNGTGHAIYHSDIELAGKTGTGEIKSSQDDTTGSEIGWFTVMTTNSDNPILITTMVEDVKDRGGSGYVVEHMQTPLNNYLYR